ncbi:hypothetical protein C0Z20_17155 [Trinickia symbiotica]|uniref:Uncharacterized protein n=1 Tax=Trinickia symbiotica TaxID=863227 RepID=A0A2N7X1V4_9BURK|nr:hypothetical protein C0Z20_17155 [Trinickia symbiotica]
MNDEGAAGRLHAMLHADQAETAVEVRIGGRAKRVEADAVVFDRERQAMFGAVQPHAQIRPMRPDRKSNFSSR